MGRLLCVQTTEDRLDATRVEDRTLLVGVAFPREALDLAARSRLEGGCRPRRLLLLEGHDGVFI